MLKITALLTTLALGASAPAAMASTNRPYDTRRGPSSARFERPRQDLRDRPDPRWSRPTARDDAGPRRYRSTWTSLGQPVELARGGEDCIEVRDPGTFTQLRLQTTGGSARVDRVVIQFADGSSQVEDLRGRLDAHDALLEIPLDGNNRQIDRIVVDGATARGDLQVFAI